MSHFISCCGTCTDNWNGWMHVHCIRNCA
jgi:hypothetical protein